MDQRLRALNRFGLGARVGEKERIGDPKQWLRGQLREAPTLDAPAGASRAEIGETLRRFRAAGQQDNAARMEARRAIVRIAASEHRAALTRRVNSDSPFAERLVAFWSNHLCVSATAKIQVAPFAGSYEREVIRPHVFGKFEDMVLASARHPAMLFYLDNWQSIGPNSFAAKRAVRERGLNENYARELLELHTLGVNGGYTQADVTQLARLLTGWTLNEQEFMFRPRLHEPGDKTVLGRRYGEGEQAGVDAIRAFCRHPSTATFIATKLVMHFVADDPPAAAVERVASVFRDTQGNLKKVSESLIDLPEAWTEANRKFRAPQDWLVATLRALEVKEANEPIVGALRQLRHPLWAPSSPKGFGDAMREWADPDSLLNRAELARTIARRIPAFQGEAASRLLDVVDVAPNDPLRAMANDSSIDAKERAAITLAGPAFQWR